jgi:hypothetical protein
VLKCKNGRMGQGELVPTTRVVKQIQSKQYLTIYR